jgi:hypothetical protein
VWLAEAQNVPNGQLAMLWALTALNGQQAGNAGTSSAWEQAEQAAAAAGERVWPPEPKLRSPMMADGGCWRRCSARWTSTPSLLNASWES